MERIISIAGIIGGTITFFSLVYRVADVVRKIENTNDRRFAAVTDRLSSIEGRLISYDALFSGIGMDLKK